MTRPPENSPSSGRAAFRETFRAAFRAIAATRKAARLHIRATLGGWTKSARRHPRRFRWFLASGLVTSVAAIGWSWTLLHWAGAKADFERQRAALHEAIADARTNAAVDAFSKAVSTLDETLDETPDGTRDETLAGTSAGTSDKERAATSGGANARRLWLDQMAGQLQRLAAEAERRPRGTLAAEQARLALARLEWRERGRPAVAHPLFTTAARNLRQLAAPPGSVEDRDRLLEAAYHGQFHTVLETRGGADLTQCVDEWTDHMESLLIPYRGQPWAGHAWTRFSTARGLLAESRDGSDNETAKRHYRDALASPPLALRSPAQPPSAGIRGTPATANQLSTANPLSTAKPLSTVSPSSAPRAASATPSTAAPILWSAGWLPTLPVDAASDPGRNAVGAERLFFDEWLEDRSAVFERLARIEFLAGDYAVAVALQRETVVARAELRRRLESRRRRLRHVEEAFTLGIFYKAAGELPASRATLEASLADAERLVADFPDWRQPRALRRDTRESLAIVYRDMGDDPRALALLVDATLALATLPLDREPSASLDDQAVIREELGQAHAAAGRKSLAWRNAIESLEIRDTLWRRAPGNRTAVRDVTRAARTALELAVTPAEWRDSLNMVEPLLERLDRNDSTPRADASTSEALGQLYLLRGRGLQLAHGAAQANADLVTRIRDSFTRARELLSASSKLTADRAREIDDRIRACDAVLKKLPAK